MRVLLIVLSIVALAALPGAAQEKPSSAKSSAAKAAPTPSAPININTATQAQFESLPGLGPKVAERILEYRLSPLYVSVHATPWEARKVLLNNPRVPDIVAQLRRLASR